MNMSADSHLTESRATWYSWASIALAAAVCALMASLVDSRWLKPLWFVPSSDRSTAATVVAVSWQVVICVSALAGAGSRASLWCTGAASTAALALLAFNGLNAVFFGVFWPSRDESQLHARLLVAGLLLQVVIATLSVFGLRSVGRLPKARLQ